MTTPTIARIEANRENALASTGPKSAEGKAIVSRNAIRHGLLSWKPTIPGLESPDDWETHLEMTMESLAPLGHMETLLVERAALLWWRLGRVARYEREAIAVTQEKAETVVRQSVDDILGSWDRKGQSAADAMTALQESRQRHQRFKAFLALPDDAAMDGASAAETLQHIAETAGFDLMEDELPDPPGFPKDVDWEDYSGWTAGLVRAGVPTIAKQADCKSDGLLVETEHNLAGKLAEAEKNNHQLQNKLEQYRRLHLLPDQETMDRVNRCETTLERSLLKTLHELERRQASRDGQAVPLPVAVDVNVSGPAQE